MKKLLLFTLLFVLFLKANSQITFNHRMNFDSPSTVLTSVLPTDSCYYISGIVVDSLPPYRVGNLFAKLDLEGNTLLRKKLTSSTATYESWDNTLKTISDNQFIVSGRSSRPDSSSVFYVKYNSIGEVIDFNQYVHPDSASGVLIHRDFQPTIDNGFIFLATIRINGNLKFHVIKIDSLGNEQWRNTYGNNKRDSALSLLVDESTGNIILGGRKTNQNVTNSNYDFQTYLIAIDSLGNELCTYLSPISEGLRDGPQDMILLDDGSLIVASGIGYEQERPSVNVVWYEKSIFKLNTNQEVEWEKEIKDITLSSVTQTTNIINLSDESGIIVAGTSAEDLPGSSTFVVSGWLAKMSYEGDSLWARKYVHLQNDFNHHEFYDIKETADGGFILCGESRDRTTGAEIPQQAWLLKLDQHGCLIPGCHLIDDVTETPTVSYELKFFPNPTSDYLNIFMRHHRGQKAFTFRILNGIGQEMTVFEQDIQEETLMIDLARYGSGVYYLEVSQEGRILETEKFVVKK